MYAWQPDLPVTVPTTAGTQVRTGTGGVGDISLAAAGVDATASIYDGVAGGALIRKIMANAADTKIDDVSPMRYGSGLWVVVTGAGAVLNLLLDTAA